MSKAYREFQIMRAAPSENGPRRCDWPGCQEDAEHRAPRSRRELKSYHWFCLDHVRAYNKSWNYYKDMTLDEVEDDLRRDKVGRRPTWPFGAAKLAYPFDAEAAFNDFSVFQNQTSGHNQTSRSGNGRRTAAEKAMAVLDLLPPVTVRAVKARYKELVKRHHPDANGGNKASEEKFKQINQAYETIMASLEA